ncbi:DNA-binding response regulator, partial [Escherichia coli]
MNNMNVIIADDHPIVLFGIRKSLEQIEWVNVVGEFEDSTALINNPVSYTHLMLPTNS